MAAAKHLQAAAQVKFYIAAAAAATTPLSNFMAATILSRCKF
jgi:hypothetical protein